MDNNIIYNVSSTFKNIVYLGNISPTTGIYIINRHVTRQRLITMPMLSPIWMWKVMIWFSFAIKSKYFGIFGISYFKSFAFHSYMLWGIIFTSPFVCKYISIITFYCPSMKIIFWIGKAPFPIACAT